MIRGLPPTALLASLTAALLGSLPAHAALTGKVVDPEDNPLEGVEVCLTLAGEVRGLCTETAEDGHYVLPSTEAARLTFEKSGFLPRKLLAVDQPAPVVLSRAATLRVRLVDFQSGEPVPEADFYLQYSTGEMVGPLPANAAGLVVRLHPGQAVPRAEAEGFAPAAGEALTLVAGEQTEIELPLLRLAPVKRPAQPRADQR